MRVLLYAGTADGRELAEWLAWRGCPVTVCVATDYGAAVLPEPGGYLDVLTGRQAVEDMARLMPDFDCAVDATHPYAVEVSRNIVEACRLTGLRYIRLRRDDRTQNGDWLRASDTEEAARLAESLEGNVLLTTGSKELKYFSADGLRERCCPRVLPSLDSLTNCIELGFSPPKIICMHGPFSAEMNIATIRQYDIKIVITKRSGDAGGFAEKAEAAEMTGCTLIVIDRPDEDGLSFDAVKAELELLMKAV